MRSNLPVTERQLELSDGVSLVSKTDLKGIITYANSAFVDVSGFRREELLGAPHNLVRHPDTPPEAFADLWNTLKRGLPWSGLVKNRCKSGDYYWVTANITPVRENGKVVGYMSVRTKAAPSAIATIEKFYAAMRAGRLRGERLEQGLIRPANPLRRLLKMNDWSIARRIYVTSTINGGVVLAAGSAFAVGAPVSLMPWVSIAVSMVCVLSGAYLVHSVARPLDVALDAANHIAAGEVTFRTGDRSASEIGRVLRTLQQIAVNVSAIVKDIKSGTSSIHRAAQALSEETFGLSRRTEDQASSLTETASSIEELSETVRQNASTAQRASQLADDASRIADDGGSAVRDVVTTMGSITESARKISEVVVLIDDIAFQTNLLALNAAVEAAHAGQHGKGFAVVAAEVRNLAQRSTEAAKEIKDLIGNSVTQVEGGYGLVTKAGETIDQVVSSVNEVRELMSHIAKATVEQSASLEQIGLAINQLEDITQQNVALVEETAAATETMQQDAARLDAAIDVFNASSAGQAPALGAAPNPSRRGAVKSAPGKMAVARRAA